MHDTETLTPDATFTLVHAALSASGLAEPHATLVAREYTTNEASGMPNHGLARVPAACKLLRSGKILGTAAPVLERPSPGVVRVDAARNFPHAAIAEGTGAVAEAARTQGIAALAVHHGFACGALGYHAEQIAAQGMVVMAFTTAPASMAPWGGNIPVVGTSPMSCAMPRRDGKTVLIDQSSSVIAKSEVMEFAAENKPVPEGWGLDSEGQPTTDPHAILNGGLMAPMAGYKGFNISMIVDVFAALLTGSNLAVEAAPLLHPEKPSDVGVFFVVVDPSRYLGESYLDRIEVLVGAIAAQSDKGVRIPGERRFGNRNRSEEEGISIPAKLVAQLREIANLPEDA